MSTRIVVTDYLEPDFNWEQEQLRKRGFEFTWHAHQLKFSSESELIDAVRDADVIIVNMAPMTENVIRELKHCRLIIRHGIGYDNVNLKAATAKGIRVANVPDYCPDEVAEQSVMLIMCAARHLPEQLTSMCQSVAKGTWDFSPVSPVHLMKGKTIGIVGCGRIGGRVYRMLGGFDMNLMVCDPYLRPERREELGISSTVPLEQLLRESDIISLHAPLNDETRGMINSRTLAMMKKSAVLVNTARGPLIVDEELAKGLKSGTIAGAALDVYHREPPEKSSPLLTAPNCLLTPHLSWYSEESGWSIREKILEDVVRAVEGSKPRFTVNPEVETILGQTK